MTPSTRFRSHLLGLTLFLSALSYGEEPKDGKPVGQITLPAQRQDDSGYEQIELLARAIETVRNSYVDPDKVEYDALIAGALEGMLRSLDPHSDYMKETVFERLQKEQENTYEGEGISIAIKGDELGIVHVREDGAAARAGIMPEDRILKIGEIFTDKVGLSEAVTLLEGKPGEKLTLTIRRVTTGETLEFTMVREVLQQDTVRDATLLHEKMAGDFRIGYVRILQFTSPTGDELTTALDRIEAEATAQGAPLDALVLDLRNNPGGLLDSAVEVCGEFIEENTLVVTTKSRIASLSPPPFKTPERNGRPTRTYPLAILVNGSSASGSEIVAGALQDLKRAVVVGTTTFGKGSVQSVIPIDGGGALRLTTAKYYTPSEKVIHEVGIEPNIVATLTPARERELMDWRSQERPVAKVAEQLAELDDTQLQRAVDTLKGVLTLTK